LPRRHSGELRPKERGLARFTWYAKGRERGSEEHTESLSYVKKKKKKGIGWKWYPGYRSIGVNGAGDVGGEI